MFTLILKNHLEAVQLNMSEKINSKQNEKPLCSEARCISFMPEKTVDLFVLMSKNLDS